MDNTPELKDHSTVNTLTDMKTAIRQGRLTNMLLSLIVLMTIAVGYFTIQIQLEGNEARRQIKECTVAPEQGEPLPDCQQRAKVRLDEAIRRVDCTNLLMHGYSVEMCSDIEESLRNLLGQNFPPNPQP